MWCAWILLTMRSLTVCCLGTSLRTGSLISNGYECNQLNVKEVTVSENVVSKNDFKKFDSLLKPKENTIKVNSDEISVYTSKLLNSAIEKYNIPEDITEQIPTVMAKTIKSIVKEIRLV